MTHERLRELAAHYSRLRVAVVGDFCLDRYLEIDPARPETSLETGLPVHNIARVRAQPGAAGTVLNNLVALGTGEIFPVGFCGDDGEGYELLRALRGLPGVNLDHFFQTPERCTFTYCKPLIMTPDEPPRELSRMDLKNWTPTPDAVSQRICTAVEALYREVDAIIVMDQVDLAETGVVTHPVLALLARIGSGAPHLPIVADSRRGLSSYPPCIFKMNALELSALTGLTSDASIAQIQSAAIELARRNERMVFVTLAERGIIGATPVGEMEHVAALPLRGPIDVVGAGDAATANLSLALAVGATLREALELATLACSAVVHQLGTSGAASVGQMGALLSRATDEMR